MCQRMRQRLTANHRPKRARGTATGSSIFPMLQAAGDWWLSGMDIRIFGGGGGEGGGSAICHSVTDIGSWLHP